MATVLVLAVTLAWCRVTMSCGGCQRLKLGLKAELAELADEAPGPDLDGALFEVVGAKILVGGTILQHVVDRGEQRCGDGAARFETLGPDVARRMSSLRLWCLFDEHRAWGES